ncbi:hypothetical protein ACVI1J_009938 [Bradyrhizobium diazoefficiens]|jgi:hypothetical protein
MGLRAPYSVDAMKLANERVDKIMARIYLLWLIGVGVGLIKLKAVQRHTVLHRKP